MSYSLYNFTLGLSGGFYVLNFSAPSGSGTLSMPSLVYLNAEETAFKLDRFSPLLVHMKDRQGTVTVDYSRCTSFVSTSASNFVSNVLALL